VEGLSGVDSVDVDLDNDRFSIRYDAAKVTPELVLRTIAEQGFTGKIVTGAPPAPPESP
jgi:copper chaperone CopZ